MKKLILIAILVAVGWQTYTKSQPREIAFADAREEMQVARLVTARQLPADEPRLRTLLHHPSKRPRLIPTPVMAELTRANELLRGDLLPAQLSECEDGRKQ